VASPLLRAENGLATQSLKHPDGWGVAWFSGSGPRVRRGVDCAHQSARFAQAVAGATSPALLAHIRKASVGGVALKNTHPFVSQGWAFAHNGTVRGFEQRRSSFERRIAPSLRAEIRGETDSEHCFLLFLSLLQRSRGSTVDSAAAALARTAAFALSGHPPGEPKPTTATFVATNGEVLVAVRAGRELGYTTHRPDCRAAGSWSAERCACQVRRDQRLGLLMVSSEASGSEHRWTRLRDGDVLGVDGDRRLRRYRLTAS